MNAPAFKLLSELPSLTSQPIYLVGGSVRDLLITNQLFKDLDLMMPSGSETVARSFAAKIDGSFFFLDEDRKITRVIKKRMKRHFSSISPTSKARTCMQTSDGAILP